MRTIEIESIRIKIGNMELDLSPEEAKELRDKLGSLLDPKVLPPIPVPCPADLPRTPWTPKYVACSNTTWGTTSRD